MAAMGSRCGERLATKEIQATSSDIMGTMMAAKVHRRQAEKISTKCSYKSSMYLKSIGFG